MTTKTMTTAEFIKSKIAEGKMEDKAILAAARKRAPEQKIGSNYVSWYRWQLKTAGKAPRLTRKNAKKTTKKAASKIDKATAKATDRTRYFKQRKALDKSAQEDVVETVAA